ncbi:MAG TPA: DUF222 domain-containing protein [Acidimicrobiales bacterium]
MFDVVELEELHRKAAGNDLTLASDAELLGAVATMARARATFDAAELHLLAEIETRGVCDREFGLSTASWLAERTRGSRPVLAGRVNTAVKLRRLAVIDSAWCAGVITSDHVRVVVDAANPRVFDQFVALQAELVDAAANEPFVAWKRDVGGLAELLDADGGYDPSKDLCRNHLHVRPLGSDGVAVSGELFGEHAMSFTTLLAAATDRL